MADFPQHLLRNPSPPLNFCFDFDSYKIEEQKYYNAFGDVCQYMNLINEDMFQSSSENEDIIFSFSDESSDSRFNVPQKKREFVKEEYIPFISTELIPLFQHHTHESPNKKIKSDSYTKTQWSEVECLGSNSLTDDYKLKRTENTFKHSEITEPKINLIPVITSFREEIVPRRRLNSADSREFSPLKKSKTVNVSYEKDIQKGVEEKICFPSPSSQEITIVYQSGSKNEMKNVKYPYSNNPFEKPNLKYGKLNLKQQEVQNNNQKNLQSIPFKNPKPNLKYGKQSNKQKKVQVTNQKKSALKLIPDINPSDYYCHICNVSTTEDMMRGHLFGKRHIKALRRRAENLPKIGTITDNAMESILPPNRHIHKISTPTKLVRTNKVSLIQAAADSCEGPLPGLSSVVEIRGEENTRYYCKICDCVCGAKAIMEHLLGAKHRIRSFEIVDPVGFERIRYVSRKLSVQRKIRYVLREYEQRHGRGRIRVKEEVKEDVTHKTNEQPSQSFRNEVPNEIPSTQIPTAEFKETTNEQFSQSCGNELLNKIPCIQTPTAESNETTITAFEELDTSKGYFHCLLCNLSMKKFGAWRYHVNGKKHLKKRNFFIRKEKESNGTSPQAFGFSVLDEVPRLMSSLKDVAEPIVGLEFLKEIQGKTDVLYHCSICSWLTSSYEIIEHLVSTKHRKKYLNAVHIQGKKNGIEKIKSIKGVTSFYRESLIRDECKTFLETHGLGKITVYNSQIENRLQLYEAASYLPTLRH